jgi:hypothetical protein
MRSLVQRLYTSTHFSVKAVVVVQNKESQPLGLALKNVFCIPGTNSLLDFSAYIEGLNFLKEQNIDDSALFLNDTLFTKLPTAYILKRMSETIPLSQCISAPCVVSFRSKYGFFLQRNPWSNFHEHLCTATFFANSHATSLLIKTYYELNDKLKKVAHINDESIETLIGKKFAGYLNLVLFSSNANWKPEIGPTLFKQLRNKKALCFYLEHYFSSLIQNSDGGIVYINLGKHQLYFFIKHQLSLMLWKIKLLISAVYKNENIDANN